METRESKSSDVQPQRTSWEHVEASVLKRAPKRKPDASIPELHSPVSPASSSFPSLPSFSLVPQTVLGLAVTSNQATFPIGIHRQCYT